MSEELKACPFCNHRTLSGIKETWGDTPSYYIRCVHCGTRGRSGFSEKEANELWSRRPIEDALRAGLARKDAEIAALDEMLSAMRSYERVLRGSVIDCDAEEREFRVKTACAKLVKAREVC